MANNDWRNANEISFWFCVSAQRSRSALTQHERGHNIYFVYRTFLRLLSFVRLQAETAMVVVWASTAEWEKQEREIYAASKRIGCTNACRSVEYLNSWRQQQVARGEIGVVNFNLNRFLLNYLFSQTFVSASLFCSYTFGIFSCACRRFQFSATNESSRNKSFLFMC